MTIEAPLPGSAGPESYGEAFADVYDRWYGGVTDADATARFVAGRCGTGPVLELGIGTGRLARPLTRTGLTVVGVDASAAMLAHCARHREPGITLVRADMAVLPFGAADGPFGAVLIGFNTLFNLPTAAAQRRLFQEVAALLAPDGALIVEALDPEALDGAAGRSLGPGMGAVDGGVTVAATEVDPAAQTIEGVHLEIGPLGLRARPWFLRWASTAQLDRWAERAGLTLTERWGSWDGDPHGPGSDVHVSVWAGPVPPGR